MATSKGYIPNPFDRGAKPINSRTVSQVKSPVSIKIDTPTSEVGGAIPYLVGRRRVSKPNVLWYGNLQAITETVTEQTTENEDTAGTSTVTTRTKTTTYVVGYMLDIQIGVCLGPDVVLRGIYVDNVAIWTGTAGPGRTEIVIGANDTAFSGCTVAWNGGAFDQAVDPLLSSVADCPAYVGIAYAIFQNMRADTQMGALHFEVERFPNPLALTAPRNRSNDDINPMTIAYDVMTSEWGGAGLDTAVINAASLQAAAIVLTTEGNFGSMLLDRPIAATELIKILQAQTYSFIFQNPNTGLVDIVLVRSGADIDEVPNLNENDIIAVQDFNKGGWTDTIEQMRGNFPARIFDYEPTAVYAQINANPSAVRKTKRSQTNDYPFITRATVALLLLARDLSLVSQPLFDIGLVATRKAASYTPGMIIKVNVPEYRFYSVPVVVSRVKKMERSSNQVLLTAFQYIVPENAATFDQPAAPFDPGVSFEPQSPASAVFVTAPYFVARRAGAVAVNQATKIVVPMIMPLPANDIQNSFRAAMSNVPNVGRSDIMTSGAYPTVGELSASVGKYDGWTTGLVAAWTIDSVVNPVNLINIGNSGVREGRIFAVINSEIISFESCTEIAPGQWQLNNVRRGLIDTVAQDHAIGSVMVIVSGGEGQIPATTFAYPLGYAPNFRIWSATPNKEGKYADALSTSGWTPSTSRSLAPPRPHDTKIDGVRNAAAVFLKHGDSATVSWRTRSRVNLAVALQTDAAEASETMADASFQKHRVFIRDSGGTDRDCGATLATGSDNDLVITVPTSAAFGPGELWVRSEIAMPYGQENSIYRDWLPVEILPTGLILSESGLTYIETENGNWPVLQED